MHAVERFKPAAPARVHLVMAALLWSVVGTLLAGFGALWIWGSGMSLGPVLAVVAVAVGIAKSRWVLDRAALRIVGRIEERGDGRCIGGFLSGKTWLLVALMAGGGRALRAWVLPPGIAGLIYLGVGAALLYSSRVIWKARCELHRNTGTAGAPPLAKGA